MLVRFITCCLILLAVAVQRNGSVFGHEIAAGSTDADVIPTLAYDGGDMVVNTTDIAGDIKGYGGAVPMEITIKEGRIAGIEMLRNAESPEFFNRAKSGLVPKWVGTPADSVASMDIDAVTGATLSSNAINATVRRGVEYALSNSSAAAPAAASVNGADGFVLTAKYVAVLVVLLCAGCVPLFVKDKRYRYLQLALNVVVLGFWSGTFLSYEIFVNYLSNGFDLLRSLPVILMLVIAFVYPYFGRMTHYCAWVCPLGSLQELAGKCVKRKFNLSPSVVKRLTAFQEILWFVLIFLMIAGIWFDWMNYELFTAFIFRSAATGVVIAAVLVVVISTVVRRPYCRFVCPTGCLFQITQNPDK